jgi:hypothetical protein
MICYVEYYFCVCSDYVTAGEYRKSTKDKGLFNIIRQQKVY